MARYRKIDPRIWGDEKFRRLSLEARYVFLHLLTGPHTTNLPGLANVGFAGLAESCEMEAEAFGEAFGEVLREGLAKADLAARVVSVPNAPKYNRPESPNVVKSWAAQFDEISECALKYEHGRVVKDFLKGFKKDFDEAFPEALLEGFALSGAVAVAVAGAGAGVSQKRQVRQKAPDPPRKRGLSRAATSCTDCQAVLAELNRLKGSKYQASGKSGAGLHARHEQHGLDACLEVVRFKAKARRTPEDEFYFRPSTLFRPDNFENALESARTGVVPPDPDAHHRAESAIGRQEPAAEDDEWIEFDEHGKPVQPATRN